MDFKDIQDFCMCAKSLQSCLTLCNPTDGNPQVLLPTKFSWLEYWRRLQCPSPGDLSDPGIEPSSLMSPALVDGFFTTSAIWFQIPLKCVCGVTHAYVSGVVFE